MTSLVDRVLAISRDLEAHGIPYAFGGALALAYHTDDPRGTNDIDVNIFLTADHAVEVFDRLPDGVTWTEADVGRVEADAQVRLFWDDTPVDLFFSNHTFHDRSAARIQRVPFPGGEIPILGADELAVFKAFFDRTKDWADIEAMQAVQSFDAHRVLGWLIDLLGLEDRRVARLRDLLHRPLPDEPRFDP